MGRYVCVPDVSRYYRVECRAFDYSSLSLFPPVVLFGGAAPTGMRPLERILREKVEYNNCLARNFIMDLKSTYRSYIQCLNSRDWANLGKFVSDYVSHNQEPLGLSGYRKMLEDDYAAIPDLHFNPELIFTEGDYVVSRLRFECTPKGEFLDLPVNGKRVLFYEHASINLRMTRSSAFERSSTRQQ